MKKKIFIFKYYEVKFVYELCLGCEGKVMMRCLFNS